ncbi:alpha-L-fucosidase [Lentzea waywayandensis]|uniref:Alpha-L-fucosidase n=1 Tax=Lentzea waywayandensis TaxID=84724 RepID=A0A1I6FIU7_9PSEU|nr:RICIN domain-containing protein [Lentzea waywayandensis]SFR29818.1 alpha-L-fucosidase [Lentzea waywayandensis]
MIDGAGSTQPGGNPVQTVYTGTTSQQWSITDAGGNVFTIANRVTGLVLDSGGDVGSGSRLKLWNDNGSPNLRRQFLVA